MTTGKLLIVFGILVLFGVYVKSWQCAEMFPNANRVACILWKG